MTLQEIVAQLPGLSGAERRALRDAIEQSLADAEPTPEEQAREFDELDALIASQPPVALPPDWNWKEEYIDYLVKKYS
jgi:hypothetical protein